MAAKKFKLFMCCLGNGITVCNSAVIEHGDYKYVAHISNCGNIKFYVKKSYIPDAEMQKIVDAANQNRSEFMERWNKLSDLKKYEIMLDSLPFSDVSPFLKRAIPLDEVIPKLEQKYFKIA